MAKYAVLEHDLSEKKACHLLNISRTTYHNHPKKADDAEIQQQLQMLAERKPR